MTQPTPYELDYSFQAWQVANPTRPLPADKLEVEFENVEITLDQVLVNLALIQRDDGALANGSVGYDQLNVEIYPGFRQPHAWVTSTAYVANDSVYSGSSLYRCLTAHTSGTFATDLAAAKWELLIDLTEGASGSGVWGSITGTLANQTDLQAALDAKQPLDSDLTTWAGLTPSANAQSLVTAANYAAMRALLDLEAGTDFYSKSAADAAFQPLDADLTTWAGLTPSANHQTLVTQTFAQMKASLDLEIGTDVQAQGATLTSLEGLSLVAGDILYATAADTLARLPKGADGQFLRLDGGLPDWETLTGGGDALVANSLAQFAATTSLELKGVISDETGSGALVFADTPTLVTPVLGTPTSGTLTNCTGLPVAGISDASANGRSLISAANYAAMKGLLDLEIGTDVQAYDADLTTWAGLTPSANAQSLVTAADYSAMRTLLGLVIGTNVQAYDADLTTWAGLTPSANAQSLVTAADYSAMRTLLGLVIGTNVQAYDADLTTWAGLTPSANHQTLVTQTFAQMRASLDLEAGTDFYSISAADAAFQPLDADLTAIAGLAATTDNFIQSKSSAWASRTPAQVMVDLHVTPTIAEKTSAGSYTMLSADDHILVNKSSGAATTVDLVTAVGRTRPVKIVDLKGDAATNNITIDGNSTETIVGLSTYLIRNNYGSVTLWPKSDGSGWYI